MLHWSQDASTGWTRNSWRGSIAKVVDVPFECGPYPGGVERPGRAADWPHRRLRIYHPPLGLRKARGGSGPASRVDPRRARSYARDADVRAAVDAAEEDGGS